jgi:hypothetical protein
MDAAVLRFLWFGIPGSSKRPSRNGIYWPEIDEDLGTEGLLRGALALRSI